MPKKRSLADELADLLNPAPAKGERGGGVEALQVARVPEALC